MRSPLLCSTQKGSKPVNANEFYPFAVVLGTAQDGGIPHAGCQNPCCENARSEPSHARLPACLGLIDPRSQQRWLLDCTPEFPRQLDRLNQVSDPEWGLSGIFLTHAHIGHYTGLIHLGREVMGTRSTPVYAMPRMTRFLTAHQPWKQLVDQNNIRLEPLVADQAVFLSDDFQVTPLNVPHRAEISETVAFHVQGPRRSVLHLPDIDDWAAWDRSLSELLVHLDLAWVDGTFYDANELPERRMDSIPHPLLIESVARFQSLPRNLRRKIHFTHLNHSNPAARIDSNEHRTVLDAGFGFAQEMSGIEL